MRFGHEYITFMPNAYESVELDSEKTMFLKQIVGTLPKSSIC